MDAQHQTQQQQPQQPQQKGARPIRVLVVDDSKSIRRSTELLLCQSGYQTSTAADGYEALCSLSREQPDIVFMDAMMPRLDGFQTCALIRQSPRFSGLPVVLVSAGEALLEKVRAELAGAQRYLVKPFRREELLRAIRELVADPAGAK